MLGLHEKYNPQYIFDYNYYRINPRYNISEEIVLYQTATFKNELQRAKNFINDQVFSIAIDVDAIQSFPSNSMSLTVFSPQHARQFV